MTPEPCPLTASKNLSQEFSEWAQCQVLEFASHYRPTDEQEVFDFMNVLDDRLSHSNSAVVMATVKMFLHYTLNMPATHQQVSLALCSWAACSMLDRGASSAICIHFNTIQAVTRQLGWYNRSNCAACSDSTPLTAGRETQQVCPDGFQP